MSNTIQYAVNGHSFHVRDEKHGDVDVIHEVFRGDCYHLHALAASGFKPEVILDIGGHIGTFAVLAHLLWPEASIYAVEPNKRSFELLQLNAPFAQALNGAIRYDKASILTDGEGATGGGFMTTAEELEKLESSSPSGEWFPYSVFDDQVQLFTLEEIIEKLGIEKVDLLKLDCEGSEIDCLQHMQRETASNIQLVLGEYHTDNGFNWFKELAESTFPQLEFTGGNGRSIGPFWSHPKPVPQAPSYIRITRQESSDMFTRPYQARVYAHDRGDFRSVRDSNVLIYFPHGFGDWVQFSYVSPFLESSNRYWMTRFGDDNVSLMEGHRIITPAYLGIHSAHKDDGGHFNNRHFGLDYDEIDGNERTLQLPLSLYETCRTHRIDTILWTDFPEQHGGANYPYHTKPRHLIPYLATPERIAQTNLTRPLPSNVNFEAIPWIRRWVEERLRNFGGFNGQKICVICRNGYTATGKNWGHMFREDLAEEKRREGQECRDFMQLLLRKDPRWMFVVIEDQLFEGDDTVRNPDLNCVSYAELFGVNDNSALPFGLVMKTLLSYADLSIGVPAGPYHLSMARAELPTVGLWIEHLPSWYDEPKPNSVHVVSQHMRGRGDFEHRPGSFFEKDNLEFRMLQSPERTLSGELVLNAVEMLLY